MSKLPPPAPTTSAIGPCPTVFKIVGRPGTGSLPRTSKLEHVGISGGLLRWFRDYLDNRKHRVVLPGASSDWVTINAGVPRGSILGPLLFLVYIHDIVTDIKSHIRLFADDTTLYIIVDAPAQAALTLNQELVKISAWANKWLVSFNPNKTEYVLLRRKINRQRHPASTMNKQGLASDTIPSHCTILLTGLIAGWILIS